MKTLTDFYKFSQPLAKVPSAMSSGISSMIRKDISGLGNLVKSVVPKPLTGFRTAGSRNLASPIQAPRPRPNPVLNLVTPMAGGGQGIIGRVPSKRMDIGI